LSAKPAGALEQVARSRASRLLTETRTAASTEAGAASGLASKTRYLAERGQPAARAITISNIACWMRSESRRSGIASASRRHTGHAEEHQFCLAHLIRACYLDLQRPTLASVIGAFGAWDPPVRSRTASPAHAGPTRREHRQSVCSSGVICGSPLPCRSPVQRLCCKVLSAADGPLRSFATPPVRRGYQT
jgi:hypothetical protein